MLGNCIDAILSRDIKVGTVWKTILVGGLNKGGKAYYALDITNPNTPKLLWEFTHANLGYSYGNPVITKNAAGTWIVAFSSGYNNETGDGKGRLFIVNANTGEEIVSGGIPTSAGSTTTPSGLAKINAWVEDATNNTATRFYGGDLLGNIWRFDYDGLVEPTNSALKLGVAEVSSTPQPITTKPMLLQAGGTSLRAGARILDACAAPGGKTAHLLELGDFDVTALDADPERLKRIADTLGRLGLKARTIAADASRPADWWDGQAFDAILLDAPCSASGIVRRHPDVRWLRRDTDIAALARTQDAILNALWPLLKPGGHLLYCTCSVFKMEGQDRIDAFLQRTADAQALPAPGHLLPVVEYLDPTGQDRGDGFFYALLTKAPTGS